MKSLSVSLITIVLLSGLSGPLVASERGATEGNTPKKPAIGYSGEQTVDRPGAPTANGADWFAEARFGMFIHWGLYAVTEGEWRGKQVPYIGEWIMHEENTWGYKAHDRNWKSAETVRKMLAEANGKNTNVLLNIGPQPDGRFPAPAIAVLENLAAASPSETSAKQGRPNILFAIRGFVTAGHLFLKNYEPTRWPAGNPETGYLDTDGGPTKTLILEMGRKHRADKFWQLNFGMRPGEELFDLTDDPHCSRNLAAEAVHKNTIAKLRARMEAELISQHDPRMAGNGRIFDEYPATSGAGFYEKFMRGEKVNASWVLPTDFEKEPSIQP